MNTLIRWMRRADTETVLDIRSECDVGSKDLLKVLSSPSYILKVAEMEGQVSGFVIYKNGKKKIKILELAVSPLFRRRGVASELINSLLLKASEASKFVEILVPEDNLVIHLLLRKCGLRACEITRSVSGCSYKFSTEPQNSAF